VTETDQAGRFPLLFGPQRWEWAGADAQFSTIPPEDPLVTNIHVVCFVGDRVVVCREERSFWFLPGGTREENETIEECVARELREEAGASLRGPLSWIGAHHCVTDHPTPYRPYQPHPEKAWLWCWADAVLDSEPTNPDDGEKVVEVRAAEPGEARRLLNSGDGWLPELVSLAVELRDGGP
jgi:8-oxo-dGTP diphosphatase